MKFRGTRGQILPLYAIALPVLLGFLALALDGGKLFVTKIHVQNAADAAALGSSLDLGPCSAGCDTDPAAESAVRSQVEADINSYSSKNGGPPILGTCAAAWYKTNHGTDPLRDPTKITGCYMWPYLKSSSGGNPNCLPSVTDPGSYACWDQVEVRIRKPVDLELARVVGFTNPAYPFARSVGKFTPQTLTTPGDPGSPGGTFPTTYTTTDPGQTHTTTTVIDGTTYTTTTVTPGATHTTTTPETTVTNTETTSHFEGGTGSVAFVKSTHCLNAPATATLPAGAAMQWSGAPSTLNQVLVNGGININGANRHHSDHIWLGKRGVANCEAYGTGADVTTFTGPFPPMDWPVPPPPAPPASCIPTGNASITASWKSTHGPGIYCFTGLLTVSANSTTFNGYSFYAPRIAVNSNGMSITNAPPPSGQPPTVFYAYGADLTDPITGLDICSSGQASNCAFSFNGGSDTINGDIFVPNGTISISGGGASVNGGTGFMESLTLLVSGNFSNYNGTGPGDGGTITITTNTTTTVIPASTQTTTDPDTTNTTTTVIDGTTSTLYTTTPGETHTNVFPGTTGTVTSTTSTDIGLGE
jgi:hypothetical protein